MILLSECAKIVVLLNSEKTMVYDEEEKKEDAELSPDLLEGVADETDDDEDEDKELPIGGDGDVEDKWE